MELSGPLPIHWHSDEVFENVHDMLSPTKSTHCLGSARRFAKSIIFNNVVSCFWSKCENWGDALNPYLIEKVSGRSARYDENPNCWKNLVIGSILDRADRYSTIWGPGMIAPDALPRSQPHAIHAVRGPLTRQSLIDAGIPCPAVFGDPALLLPRYFNPPRTVKWKIGVIPHYVDEDHPWIQSIRGEEEVKVINIRSGIEEFVHDVLSCEAILSSSLHGLICADSYRIPNRRLRLSDGLIGGDFKFNDYYGGIATEAESAVRPKVSETAKDVGFAISHYHESRNQEELLDACPFRAASRP